MAFKDRLSVTVATREGGRVAASAANYNEADCVILEATAGALQSFESGTITRVHIYKSNENGNFPGPLSSENAIYRPVTPSDPPIPICNSWRVVKPAPNWEPPDRVNPGGDPFWIGVRLEFAHPWQTGFLWWSGSANWSDDSVFRIEPPPPDLN
jgi:hypothetical protein